ncbi:MAG: hypothetical protein WC901_07445 [Candidatus Margulisiibacteriota bacterium]
MSTITKILIRTIGFGALAFGLYLALACSTGVGDGLSGGLVMAAALFFINLGVPKEDPTKTLSAYLTGVFFALAGLCFCLLLGRAAFPFLPGGDFALIGLNLIVALLVAAGLNLALRALLAFEKLKDRG